MSFWKKVFGLCDNDNKQKGNSRFENYSSGLNEKDLKTSEDLKELVNPLIKNATKIEVQEPSRPPKKSQLNSHFGGQPYFEEGEDWPKSQSGRNMEFIFQIFNEEGLELPKEIKLLQFFYDWEEFPWETENDGWLVKIYEELIINKIKKFKKPSEQEIAKYCEIKFIPIKSQPDWEGLDLYNNTAAKLACTINENKPWDSYGKIVEMLIGEEDYKSQLGGYPKWVQGESTPKNIKGDEMKLLFQLDSEDNAGLMWGDVGLIYLFYDVETKKIEFTLQCH